MPEELQQGLSDLRRLDKEWNTFRDEIDCFTDKIAESLSHDETGNSLSLDEVKFLQDYDSKKQKLLDLSQQKRQKSHEIELCLTNTLMSIERQLYADRSEIEYLNNVVCENRKMQFELENISNGKVSLPTDLVNCSCNAPNTADMILCSNGTKCQHGPWFHPACAASLSTPLNPSPSLLNLNTPHNQGATSPGGHLWTCFGCATDGAAAKAAATAASTVRSPPTASTSTSIPNQQPPLPSSLQHHQNTPAVAITMNAVPNNNEQTTIGTPAATAIQSQTQSPATSFPAVNPAMAIASRMAQKQRQTPPPILSVPSTPGVTVSGVDTSGSMPTQVAVVGASFQLRSPLVVHTGNNNITSSSALGSTAGSLATQPPQTPNTNVVATPSTHNVSPSISITDINNSDNNITTTTASVVSPPPTTRSVVLSSSVQFLSAFTNSRRQSPIASSRLPAAAQQPQQQRSLNNNSNSSNMTSLLDTQLPPSLPTQEVHHQTSASTSNLGSPNEASSNSNITTNDTVVVVPSSDTCCAGSEQEQKHQFEEIKLSNITSSSANNNSQSYLESTTTTDNTSLTTTNAQQESRNGIKKLSNSHPNRILHQQPFSAVSPTRPPTVSAAVATSTPPGNASAFTIAQIDPNVSQSARDLLPVSSPSPPPTSSCLPNSNFLPTVSSGGGISAALVGGTAVTLGLGISGSFGGALAAGGAMSISRPPSASINGQSNSSSHTKHYNGDGVGKKK